MAEPFDIFLLDGREGCCLQQIGHADNGIHRGSNLVTHGSEKFAFCLRRRWDAGPADPEEPVVSVARFGEERQ